MVTASDFKYFKFSCLVARGRYRGKKVIAMDDSRKVTGEVRATDEAYATRLAIAKVHADYGIAVVTNMIVEESK